jgi:hypothetical protein
MSKPEWNGREVVFGEYDLRVGKAVREAFAESGEQGSYACLAASLRYADSGELVFASVDDVWAQPARLQGRVLRLAGEAAKLNGMVDDADAEGDRTTNGSGERDGPSL